MKEYTACLTTQGVFVLPVWLFGDMFFVSYGRLITSLCSYQSSHSVSSNLIETNSIRNFITFSFANLHLINQRDTL